MKKNLIWLVALMAAVAVTPAYGVGIEVAVGGWQQNAGGTLNYKGFDSDDDIDIADDLDYDSETRVMGRVKIDMPLMVPNIYIIAAPMEFEGTGRKNVSFTFGEVEFSSGADFDSKVTLNQYDLAFYYGIPAINTATAGMLNIDVGLNARFVDFSAEITGEENLTSTTVTEEESLSIVIPMAYAAVQITPMDRFAFEAEARAISISGNSLYSIIGRVRVNLPGPAFIAGGYRHDEIDIDEDDILLEARFSGPFLEVGLAF